MERYIFRRLVQAVLTVFGVMLITFVLFRQIAGDVSAAYVNQKLGHEARQSFYEKHKLDRPGILNLHNRLVLIDNTTGEEVLSVRDSKKAGFAKEVELHLASEPHQTVDGEKMQVISKWIYRLKTETVLSLPDSSGKLAFRFRDNTGFELDATGVKTFGELVERIQNHPENQGKVTAMISEGSFLNLFNSQFFWHLFESVTFSGKSYATDQSVLEIIAERAKFSLSLSIPAMILGWFLALFISCLVAYYRDTTVDRLGVFVSVLGMCVPYLAYMIFGQWIMFKIAPDIAVGLTHPGSIFAPVLISVVAGLGWSVRFYRTVILDQVNKDYVRTARAKGVSLFAILFKHVLRNSMLPILTNLISSIPFLIMGSLLLERFFGIPGLGDLMLTSISSRDVPIITGLTFLTSVLYVISLLITDILYAVFDPRIRLR